MKKISIILQSCNRLITILDVKLGAKTLVLSVLQDTISIKMEFAAKLKVVASNSTLWRESAKSAMKDIILSMANAKEQTTLPLRMSDAPLGLMESALSAQEDGSSMLKKFVFQLVIFALPGVKKEFAPAAIEGMTSLMENVKLTMIILLKMTSIVKLGSMELVWNVVTEPSLMLIKNVQLSAVNAIPSIN